MSKKITVEQRTKEVVNAINEFVRYTNVRKLHRWDLLAYATGYARGQSVKLDEIEAAIMALYMAGAIEA